MHVHIHIYIYIFIYTYLCMYIFICIHVCVHTPLIKITKYIHAIFFFPFLCSNAIMCKYDHNTVKLRKTKKREK